MVAMTTTLLSSMGSRVVLPQTGMLMNNGVMWFDPRPGQPNSIAPGKRPLTNMFPVILRDGGQPWIAAGASGGRRIMAAVFQLMSFVADFGMDAGGGGASAAHRRVRPRQGHAPTGGCRRTCCARCEADGPVEMVEHGVLPINFACPNLIVQRGRHAHRHQRRRLALVGGGGAGVAPHSRRFNGHLTRAG